MNFMLICMIKIRLFIIFLQKYIYLINKIMISTIVIIII